MGYVEVDLEFDPNRHFHLLLRWQAHAAGVHRRSYQPEDPKPPTELHDRERATTSDLAL